MSRLEKPVDGVLFITGNLEFPHLSDFAKRYRPAIEIFHAPDRESLDRHVAIMPTRSRLIAFATSVIVPANILNVLSLTPYNFHPGSPEFPGRFPESFAVYDGATSFGATAHVMVPRVDEGAIIGVERFDVPALIDRMTLADLTYHSMVKLFANLVPIMVTDDSDLPVLPHENWSGVKRTYADYDHMRQITPEMDAAEQDRRLRAFGKQES